MRVRPEDAFKDLTERAAGLAVKISTKKDAANRLPTTALVKARHQSILALEAIAKVVSELFEADKGRPTGSD